MVTRGRIGYESRERDESLVVQYRELESERIRG
jgi:hypothetical protein